MKKRHRSSKELPFKSGRDFVYFVSDKDRLHELHHLLTDMGLQTTAIERRLALVVHRRDEDGHPM